MKTLIIIPTYNEKANISLVLEHITTTVPHVDIVVVDDNSPDGTADAVKSFAAASQKNIKVLRRTGRRGLGAAYKIGFAYGLSRGYELLVTMDADMSHNPMYLPAMLTAAQDNDIIIGSRYIRDGGTVNWKMWRVLLSRTANTFARFVLNVHGYDLTSGYRVYRREILEKINLNMIRSNGYSFLVEMLFYAQQHQARVYEIPIIFLDRTMGTSKISKKEIYRGAFTLFRLRFTSFFTKNR